MPAGSDKIGVVVTTIPGGGTERWPGCRAVIVTSSGLLVICDGGRYIGEVAVRSDVGAMPSPIGVRCVYPPYAYTRVEPY